MTSEGLGDFSKVTQLIDERQGFFYPDLKPSLSNSLLPLPCLGTESRSPELVFPSSAQSVVSFLDLASIQALRHLLKSMVLNFLLQRSGSAHAGFSYQGAAAKAWASLMLTQSCTYTALWISPCWTWMYWNPDWFCNMPGLRQGRAKSPASVLASVPCS